VRPVNLIPPEDRRGEAAPLRTGLFPYVLLGVLGIILVTVTALVMTSNSIKDQQAQLDALDARAQAASTAAASLTPYTQFASLAQARNATVTSLAQSRFDWERVLRELSLVIPDDVKLTAAVASSAAGGSAEGDSSLAGSATGPSLSFKGCAEGQRGVAAFAAALHDIDGVTRVGIHSSQLPTSNDEGSGNESAGGCEGGPSIAAFEVDAVFDGVATPPGAAPEEPATGETAATDPGTADGVAEEQQARDAAASQTEKARNAANLAPGADQ
jgi:Tfp pilus assembly protein PilN